ncbi:NAD(P)/FAD-dependent oxidoreductase [Rubinisphaera margarita]|uniref:NAD(P)/FAD-dependent oxidoreductase n=1 Tax=Rubinisphaera margarita TaxID=2909586 RepID=UPI001EE90AFD|nr:NAD(P)/FAD-dependent oxidoreductase [Rubinisphaera margarita]MCG6158179.1 NAD(P)/FAD-dependent oxidoreductase [Rubinisphaera margarita]
MIAATTTVNVAAEKCWDVIIVGSGLAGSVAAIELARKKLSVLLLDQKSFPRSKPCGGCLNAEALHHLESVGVIDTINSLGGEPYSRFDLWTRGRNLSLNLPTGLGISRYRLDAALIERAVEAGAAFLPATSGQVQPRDSQYDSRTVLCRDGNVPIPVNGRVILLATGLSGNPVTGQPGFDFSTAPNGRIGLQATVPIEADFPLTSAIHMAVGRSGYVGLARIESSMINLAAAITPSALRNHSPADVCGQILAESGVPFAVDIPAESWQGTVKLTRSRKTLADERLFIVGDAAGYIEPFTGEGMATAIRGARAVVEFAAAAAQDWDPRFVRQWDLTMRRKIIRRWPCNVLSQLLRVPVLVRLAMGITVNHPVLGRTIVKSINRNFVDEKSITGPRHSRAG